MNQQLFKLGHGLLVFLLTAGAGFSAKADDTEIFFGGISNSYKSNVLFILDTSGSMDNLDCYWSGGTQICNPMRIDRMKTAFTSLLAGMNNVNVGLMRFNQPGGPILYPVTDIDGVIQSSTTVTSRIDAAENDAEEDTLGTVTLDNNSLAITTRTGTGGSAINVAVNDGDDDAEERVASNSINVIRSAGLEIPYDDYTVGDASREHRMGVIFRGLAIPANAIITSAFISFEIERNDGDSKFTNTLYLDIEGQAAGTVPDFNGQNIESRTRTSASTTWTITESPGTGETIETPDLSSIVGEITSDVNWTSGGDMAFFFERNPSDPQNAMREFSSYDSGHPPELTVVYDIPTTPSKQTIGLRFTDVKIPKGATIMGASLQFTGAAANSDTANFIIRGELTDDAAPFTTATNDITGRTTTTAAANWTPSAWTSGTTHATSDDNVDLTGILQEIVDQSGWCGGQDMAFIIEDTGTRYADAFDGNPSNAPLLQVQFNTESLGPSDGCIYLDRSYSVQSSNDDAEQRTNRYATYTSRQQLTLGEYNGNDQAVGVRFTDISLEPGTTVVSAYLEFTAAESDSSSMSSLSIQIEDDADGNSFRDQYGRRVRPGGSRSYYSDTIYWSGIPSWNRNETYRSPDVASLVQKVVDRGDWASGKNLVFKIQMSGSGRRRAYSEDGNPQKAPRLIIKTQNSATVSASSTTRDQLTSLVEQFQPAGGTPIVDVLYEAALYFTGGDVEWGRVRGWNSASSSSREKFRLSHSESYTGGTVVRPSGCSESNLNDSDCIDSYIDGSPEYISPIDNECSSNHIVLLTDGQPTVNESKSKIETLIGGSCAPNDHEVTDRYGNLQDDARCLNELAAYLHDTDHNSSISGVQNVYLHTIAFNAASTADLLTEAAQAGNGQSHSAESADDLLVAFEEILAGTDFENTNFVSAGVSVNTFNRLTHRNDMYFALFRPDNYPHWPGNLKRYKLEYDSTDQEAKIVDVNGNAAVDTSTGRFYDTAKSWWSTSADGNDAGIGGAADNVPNYGSRKMYTYYSGSTSKVLSSSVNAFNKTNSFVTKDMLGITYESDTYRENLMDWFLGKDVLDADGDSVTDETRHRFADPLHSVPRIITYGGTEEAPDLTVYYGDNEGLLHAIDADDGTELFSFIPEDLLGNINTLYNNSASDDHLYGLDGVVNSWVNDVDGDSNIESEDGDFVYIYFGMRRGGRNYYALDVTNRAEPKVLWTIEGGSGDFGELGQTWSRPVKSRVNIDGTVTDVLIFTGGYDDSQDDASVITADSQGRALYIVDAASGELLWNAEPSGALLNLPEMKYSIPSSPRVIDVDGDQYGMADQIYVGDVGGQVWRFDIHHGEEKANLVTGGVIANIAGTSLTDARRFYHEPEVGIIVEDNQRKLAVLIGSGFRAHPLNDASQDRMYMIKQTDVLGAPADGPDAGTDPDYVTLTEADLYDTGTGVADEDLTSVKAANGWYFSLTNFAEKILSTPLLVANRIYVTSYSPSATSGTGCVVSNGTSRIYEMDVYSSNAIDDEGSLFTNGERFDELKTIGIASDPVYLRMEDGDSVQGVVCIGKECFAPKLNSGFLRTYWYTR